MTIECQAIEFETAGEAIQHVDASGRGVAVRINGENLVIDDADADRLAAAGVSFAYLCDHEMPNAESLLPVPAG